MSESLPKQKNLVRLGDLDRAMEALEHQWQVLRSQTLNQASVAQTDDYADLVSVGKIVASLKALAEQIHTDAEIATDLQRGEKRSIAQLNIYPPMQPQRSSIIDTLRNNLTFNSVIFRHALRLALIVTTAELVAALLQVPTGYWVTLTAVVALKPNFGGTSQTHSYPHCAVRIILFQKRDGSRFCSKGSARHHCVQKGKSKTDLPDVEAKK